MKREVLSMKKSRKMKKGRHEQAMEMAKEMIDKGIGMSKIVEETKLTEEDVTKAKDKWVDQS
jgi:DNA-binding phage protein